MLRQRVVVIPAYREATVIGAVVRDARAICDRVIVVDDGSPDDTAAVAEQAGATVLRHAINRGAGGASGTGIQAALKLGATSIVTMDADGQHQGKDVARAFERLDQGDIDVLIGSRLLDGGKGMPAHRRVFNAIGNVLTYLLFGVWVTDSQSGMRGLTRAAAEVLELRTGRWEANSEFIQEIRAHGWRYAEIPIPAIYTEYSLSKGQSLGGGFRTAARLIARRFLG